MSHEHAERTSERIVDKFVSKGASVEVHEVSGRGIVYSLHNPLGMELSSLVDPLHKPRITNFTDVILSSGFAFLREKDEVDNGNVNLVKTDPLICNTISTIAGHPNAYDSELGRNLRKLNLNVMGRAMKRIYESYPIQDNDRIIPVVRCGANIANSIGIQGLPSEAKRLRFKDDPNLLGAGGNFTLEYLSRFIDTDVRLCEGIGASGTTEVLYSAAFENWDIYIRSLSGDFVVSCAAGANFAADFKKHLGIFKPDNACFKVGILNKDWYVTYPDGKQVMGDGGDLTSNIN